MSSRTLRTQSVPETGGRRKLRLLPALFAVFAIVGLVGPAAAELEEEDAGGGPASQVTWLTQDDFRYGTYIIDRPGTYKLAEDITFNPNSPETLTAAIASGELDPGLAAALGLPLPPDEVDAFHAGFPLASQFALDGVEEFTPGGPMDPRYDPSAFGLGFFAAIAISADGVVLDLNGHTLAQHPEHALLMRFFALIELADQPFVPSQGPSDFGSGITPATNVIVRNGTLGLSSHHGIHGNLNESVTVTDVDFDGYEVGAVALNSVDDLLIRRATATNRKDVPVVGTFSSAQFIKPYVEELVRTGSTTELTVGGESYSATEIRDALQASINAVHHDIIVDPNIVDGRAQIDAATHPAEYALYSNAFGLLDGNSYSFLVNSRGIAVNGFPHRPEIPEEASDRVRMYDIKVEDQWAFINEIPTINRDGAGIIDPVGAVFQVLNTNPDDGEPVTVSSLDQSVATYTGNAVANAQALVAKATLNGEFDESNLDVSRLNISAEVLNWIEGAAGWETLADLNSDPEAGFFCNGDSMFHVNKGVIAYKIDGASGARLVRTSATGLRNFGLPGTSLCGDYAGSKSHPLATLEGYGGALTRGYSVAGSENVTLLQARTSDIAAAYGYAIGVDVFTDSHNVAIVNSTFDGVYGGTTDGVLYEGPNLVPEAIGVHVGPDASQVSAVRVCATDLVAPGGGQVVHDESGSARLTRVCRS